MYRNGPEDLMHLAIELTDPIFALDAPPEQFQRLTEARDLWWRTFGRDNEKFTKKLERSITEARNGNWSSLIKLLAAQHETTADLEELKVMTTVDGPDDDKILVINHDGIGTLAFGNSGGFRRAPDSLFQHLPPHHLSNDAAKRERREIANEWNRKENQRRSEAHVKALENMVRGWIRWAKQEGRF